MTSETIRPAKDVPGSADPCSKKHCANPDMTQELGLQPRRKAMEMRSCLKQAQVTFSIVDTP